MLAGDGCEEIGNVQVPGAAAVPVGPLLLGIVPWRCGHPAVASIGSDGRGAAIDRIVSMFCVTFAPTPVEPAAKGLRPSIAPALTIASTGMLGTLLPQAGPEDNRVTDVM